jgi:uncharacterized protein (DUF1499 family)
MPGSLRLFRSRRTMSIAAIATLLLALAVAGMFLLSLTAGRPDNLGVHNGRLSGCPESPNCVCTQASGQQHWIEPLTSDADAPATMQRIVDVLATMSGVTIIERGATYLHAEFRSPFFRFVDDVEFLLEPETGRIHFRSASRVGYSDLSANRKRMEEFRRRFKASSATTRAGKRSRRSRSESDANHHVAIP